MNALFLGGGYSAPPVLKSSPSGMLCSVEPMCLELPSFSKLAVPEVNPEAWLSCNLPLFSNVYSREFFTFPVPLADEFTPELPAPTGFKVLRFEASS